MPISQKQKNEIENLLRKVIKEKLKKYGRETTSMPFLESIIQDNEKVVAYSFIHSIATSLGQSIFEKVSVILAKTDDSIITTSRYKHEGYISPARQETITNIIKDLKTGARKADIKTETCEILKSPTDSGKSEKVKSIVDFYMCKNGKEYFFEIKTAKPNKDVFSETKNKLLKWIAMAGKPINVYIALPYNPYYPEPYARFTIDGLMDPPNDFLVGEEYWNFIGGKGTLTELLNIFEKIGKEFKSELNNKFKEIATKKETPN